MIVKREANGCPYLYRSIEGTQIDFSEYLSKKLHK